MTGTSSKIDDRRLKLGDSLMEVSTNISRPLHCALPGLVFLVLSRS